MWTLCSAVLAALCVAVSGTVTVTRYSNMGLFPPGEEKTIPTPSTTFPANAPFSSEMKGTVTFPRAGWYDIRCNFTSTTVAHVWVNGHMVCHDNHGFIMKDGESDVPLRIQRNLSLPFRAVVFYANETDANEVAVSFEWRDTAGGEWEQPPSSAFTPYLSDIEEMRNELQSSLARGWGLWNHGNMLDVVLLPHSLATTLELCRSQTECITGTKIEGPAKVRVGMHAPDRSYVQFYYGEWGANVSVELSARGADVDIIVTPVASISGLTLRVNPGFRWFRAGKVEASQDAVTFHPFGLPSVTLHTTSPAQVQGQSLTFNLKSDGVGLSTVSGSTLTQLQQRVGAQESAARKRMTQLFGEREEVATAIQASVMWNLIYVTAENGPVLPVSRSWNFQINATSDEWTYVIFDWDNFFASYLAGLDPDMKNVSYSNIIQTVRSKTSAGFVPNYSAGGRKSQDRTEPPVGAKVLLELYRKYQDKWLVELLFDDLLDWSNWFMESRLLPPDNMVCLGSWNEPRTHKNPSQGDPGNVMQDARFESGLDNSPMYDGEFFNKTSHKMELYDVGFNSMVAMDAGALAELADIIGRQESGMLRQRAETLRTLISEKLWDDAKGIFVNRFSNGTFYPRISPTSFYPFQAKAATDSQAEQMVTGWLLSPKHFCITPKGDFAGNADTCYWGLPSIEASDPAYPPLGYWRGYVWGPMAQLTYWALQEYDHVAVVKEGRQALCKQMTSLMLNQWRLNRHICENYNPHKSATDCSGTKFYHWGALTGLITMIEEGYW